MIRAAQPNRLDHLDGLRTLAVLLVVVFHWTVRWSPPNAQENLYPYGSSLSGLRALQFGSYGVQFFFMISGFVITMTLERCVDRREFMVRRFARLWPALFACVCIALSVTRLLPQGEPFRRGISSIVPSLTLVPPELWNRLGIPVAGYADGVLWSLWVEVLFYAVAALLFFRFRDRFLTALTAFAGALTLLTFISSQLMTSTASHGGLLTSIANKFDWFLATFPLNQHIWWFVFGSAMWMVSNRRGGGTAWGISLTALGAQLWVSLSLAPWSAEQGRSGIPLAVMIVCLFLLFASALHLPSLQRVLGVGALALIGRASYCVYLLHQFVGLTLLRWLADQFGLKGTPSLILAPVSIFLVTAASILLYRMWEVPMQARTLIAYRSLRSSSGAGSSA